MAGNTASLVPAWRRGWPPARRFPAPGGLWHHVLGLGPSSATGGFTIAKAGPGRPWRRSWATLCMVL